MVIDEVGKMELFSQSFVQTVRRLMLGAKTPTVVTTIPVPKGKPLGLVEEIRHSSQVQVFEVHNLFWRTKYFIIIVKPGTYIKAEKKVVIVFHQCVHGI